MRSKLIVLLLLFVSSCSCKAVELENTRIENVGLALSLGTAGLGASVFSLRHHAELAATFIGYGDDYGSNKSEQSDARLHLRHFFKERMDGWYYGGFVQRSELSGKLRNQHNNAEQSKTSLGLEVGYLSFSVIGHRDLYWGVGAGASYYLGADEQDIFESDDLPGDSPTSVFFDLIRVGAVF